MITSVKYSQQVFNRRKPQVFIMFIHTRLPFFYSTTVFIMLVTGELVSKLRIQMHHQELFVSI